MYASLGAAEKTQLLRLNVPATFIQVALDEGPGPPIKYQYAELSKLYQVYTRFSSQLAIFALSDLSNYVSILQVVSLLVRCCDVSSKCQSAVEGKTSVLPNPYLDASCPSSSSAASGDASPHHVPLYPLQPAIASLVYDRYRDELMDANCRHC